MFRPRGSLARALYEKFKADEELKAIDKNEWYAVVPSQLLPELQKTFLQLSLDEETEEFLDRSAIKSSWILTQIWHCLVKALLNFFMTQTSINGCWHPQWREMVSLSPHQNTDHFKVTDIMTDSPLRMPTAGKVGETFGISGLLRRGSMFVFSRSQFELLTDWHDLFPDSANSKLKLLDLGAGDGVVTSVISPLFDEIFVTEVSPTMKWILTEKGFRILDDDHWSRESTEFDVITCLNLLDRCDRPNDILQGMKRVLSDRGIVVLALVLPFKPYVETGSKSHSPSQILDIDGCTFEGQVGSVVKNVLEPIGFEVLRWTRLPYLCEGDLRQSYYWLDDVVLVMKKIDHNHHHRHRHRHHPKLKVN